VRPRHRNERAALNEDLFRRMNERLHALSRVGGTPEEGTAETERFLCECSDTSCAQVVDLAAAEYRAVRETNRRFLVFPDETHTNLEIEVVAERHDRYWVVEKIGDAGAEAELLAEDDRNPL